MSSNERESNEPQQHSRKPNTPQYKFTAEEVRVLKECNRESFYQRCLPLGALFGFTTYYGVKTGYFRSHHRLGATPKVAVAVIIGYFLGKFSYQSKCAEKLMQLPNSQFGEMLRKRRQGNLHESLDSGFGPGMALTPFSGISSSDTYTDLGPTALDMDTSRPQYDGLDDSQRPSLDNPVFEEEEEMPPQQKHITTYDDLRKQNREEYQKKRTMSYREPPKSATPQAPSNSQPVYDSNPKNKYGDSME